jgi:hypothetical protein
LTVRVLGITAGAESVRIMLHAPDHTYSTDYPAVQFPGEAMIESVAAGDLDVEAEAVQGTAVLAAGHASASVVDGTMSVVTIDLGTGGRTDGGVDQGRTVSSNPVSVVVRNLRGANIDDGTLTGSVDMNSGGAYQSFIEGATALFGHRPATVRIDSGTVSILPATSSANIQGLQDLWSGRLRVSFTVTPGELASYTDLGVIATPTGLSQTLPITANAATLAPLQGALLQAPAPAMDLALVGTTAKQRFDNFFADVEVTLVYTATER